MAGVNPYIKNYKEKDNIRVSIKVPVRIAEINYKRDSKEV